MFGLHSAVGGVSVLLFISGLVLVTAQVPSWTPTWKMSESTVVMPCNYSGFFDPVFLGQFGIVDFDWSNGKMDWANQKPMDCEERLITQAEMVKKVNPQTKVWVYRNFVKALPWYTSVREKITDSAYAGWFLKFKATGPYHVPQCTGNLCSNLYHDQDQTPHHPSQCREACDCGSVPCGEYLFDHRNNSLRDWIVTEFILGKNGLGNPIVSGFYLDDGWTNYSAAIQPWQPKEGFCDHSPIGGATEEDYYCTVDMGLTQQDTTAIYDGWRETVLAVHKTIQTHGGWSWDQFHRISTPNKDSCTTFFRANCGKLDNQAVMHTLNWHQGALLDLEADLATFLLVRGPYAWLGYGWSGCSSGTQPPGGGGSAYVYPDAFKVDYGTPNGHCTEISPGVFKRQWSNATVTMDCNNYKASITA